MTWDDANDDDHCNLNCIHFTVDCLPENVKDVNFSGMIIGEYNCDAIRKIWGESTLESI